MWSGAYWRKAPFALLRRPPLFAAVLAGSLLVALAAASSTLFSTAAGNAALRGKLDEITPFGAGLYVSWPTSQAPGTEGRAYLARVAGDAAALRRAVASIPSLHDPLTTLFGPPLVASGTPGGATILVRPVSRPGFAAHVHRLSSAGGSGVWLASSAGHILGVAAGGRLRVQPPAFFRGRPVSVRVAAVYRPLWDEPVRSYWANFSDVIYPPPAGQDGPTPPTFLLAGQEQLLSLLHRARGGGFEQVVELPIETRGITLRRAERIQRRFGELGAELRAGRTPLARRIGCRVTCVVRSSLTAAIELARRDVDAVSAPTRLLSDIGVLIALGVFAAAGAYLVVRRRAEARLLYARGVPAAGFAAHSALEALLPVVLGGLAGYALALGLVRAAQPTGALDGIALRSAAARAALGVAAGLALLAGAAALTFLRQYEATAWAGRRLGALPWELVLVGVSVWLLVDVTHGGGVDAHGVPSLEVFLLPLLLLAGVAGLALRAARIGLARAARRDTPLPLYLSLRRLAAGRGALVLLATLSAVALGLLFYAQTLAGSLAASAREKAYVSVGGDVQGTINADEPLPRGFPYPLTKVQIAYGAVEIGGPAGAQIDAISVDPATAGGVIRWDPSWGPPPGRWLGGLDARGPLPVVVAPPLRHLRAIWVSGERVPVRVAAVVRAFPGMGTQPFLVASGRSLDRALARVGAGGALTQSSALVWGRGPAVAVRTALAASPLRPAFMFTVGDVLRNPDIAVATRTFSFLRALGFAVGALAFVGVLLYLYARQRGQAIASAFARRMGVRRGAELLALWIELAAVLVFAAALAAVVAVSAAGPVVRHTDPIPRFQPGPVLAVPWGWIGISFVVVAVFALVGAAAAEELARRADVGEELRLV